MELKMYFSKIKYYFKKENKDFYSSDSIKEISPLIQKYEKSKKAMEELLKEFEINKDDSLEKEIKTVKEFLEQSKEDKVQDNIKKIKDHPEYIEKEEGIKNEVVEFDLYNSKEVKERKKQDIEKLNDVANKLKDLINDKGLGVTAEQQKVFNTIENMNQNDNIKIEEKTEPINQHKKKKKKKCLIM